MRDWEKNFAAKNLQAELHADDDLPPLQADEGRLQEVIYNLLDNAVKYSQPGGCITVVAVEDGDRMSLSVSDNGAGIPAQDYRESLSGSIAPIRRVIGTLAAPGSGFRS